MQPFPRSTEGGHGRTMSSVQEVVRPGGYGTKERRFLLLDAIFDDQGGREERFWRCQEVQVPSGHSKEFLLLRRSRTNADAWRRDLSTSSQLRHPNILGYCGAWESPDDVSYMLCERARMFLSVRLREMGQAGPGGEMYRRWLLHISSALEYLHDQNNEDRPMLHRAVQPDNILVTDRGVLKMCAFDTAKRLVARHGTTHTVYGGGLFQSPEIRDGRQYNQSVDIWGFGVTAVYIANYTRAGKAGSAAKLVSILKESGQDPGTVRVVEETLQEDPRHRPTASLIVQQLKEKRALSEMETAPSLASEEHQRTPVSQTTSRGADSSSQRPPNAPARSGVTHGEASGTSRGHHITPQGPRRSDTFSRTSPIIPEPVPSWLPRSLHSSPHVPPQAAGTIPPPPAPSPAQVPAVKSAVSPATVDMETQTSFYRDLPDLRDRQTSSTQTSQTPTRHDVTDDAHSQEGQDDEGARVSKDPRRPAERQRSSRGRASSRMSSGSETPCSQTSATASGASPSSTLSDLTVSTTSIDTSDLQDFRIQLERVHTMYGDTSSSNCATPAHSPQPQGQRPGSSTLHTPQPALVPSVRNSTPNRRKPRARTTPSLMNYDSDSHSGLSHYKTERVRPHSKSNMNYPSHPEGYTKAAEHDMNKHTPHGPTRNSGHSRVPNKHHHHQQYSDDEEKMAELDKGNSAVHARDIPPDYRGHDRRTISNSNPSHLKDKSLPKDSRPEQDDRRAQRKSSRTNRSSRSHNDHHPEPDKVDDPRITPRLPPRAPYIGGGHVVDISSAGLDAEVLQKIYLSVRDRKKIPEQAKQKRRTSRSAEQDDLDTGHGDRGEGDWGQQGRGHRGRGQEIRGHRTTDLRESVSSLTTDSAERPDTRFTDRHPAPYDDYQASRGRHSPGDHTPHLHPHTPGPRAPRPAPRPHDLDPAVETDGTSGLGDSCRSQEFLDY